MPPATSAAVPRTRKGPCMKCHRSLTVVLSLLSVASLGGCQGWFQSPTPLGTERISRSPEAIALERERLTQAEQAKAAGDYDTALALFEDILRENPGITSAHLGVGDIQLEQENYEEAEVAFRRATRLEPGNFDAQYGLGVALQMLNRLAEAVEAYHKALTIRPDDFDANLNLATTYLQQGRPEFARPFAERAVELRPEHGGARVNLGAVYDQLDLDEEAIETYRVAMELVEPTPELILNLVKALGDAGRYREAINAAETLNRMAPNADAWERIGWAHFRLAEYEASMDAYRRAVELDPSHWVAYNGIGVNALNDYLLSKRKNAEAARVAREALRRSLQINADQPKIVRLLSNFQI